MGYKLLQFILRVALKLSYRKIIIEGKENIPKTGPLLIAASHPNSFLDAIILGCIIKRPLYFLARSDVFRQKWADTILRKMHLIPIYRMQEGKNNLNKNEDTFRACYQLLQENKAILIFAEGLSEGDRQIRPVKKGLSRIAFGAYNYFENEIDSNILVAGLNYESISQFHNRVLVSFEAAIKVSSYLEEYSVNQTKAQQSLNGDIKKGLEQTNAIVDADKEDVFDNLLSEVDDKNFSIKYLQEVAQRINQSSSSTIEETRNAINHLQNFLNKKRARQALTEKVGIGDYLIILLLPLRLIAMLIYFIPLGLADYITVKKVVDIEFFTAVKVSLRIIFTLIWTAILTIILTNMYGPFFLTFPIIGPLLITIYSKFNISWFKIKSSLKFLLLAKKEKEKVRESLAILHRLLNDI